MYIWTCAMWAWNLDQGCPRPTFESRVLEICDSCLRLSEIIDWCWTKSAPGQEEDQASLINRTKHKNKGEQKTNYVLVSLEPKLFEIWNCSKCGTFIFFRTYFILKLGPRPRLEPRLGFRLVCLRVHCKTKSIWVWGLAQKMKSTWRIISWQHSKEQGIAWADICITCTMMYLTSNIAQRLLTTASNMLYF